MFVSGYGSLPSPAVLWVTIERKPFQKKMLLLQLHCVKWARSWSNKKNKKKRNRNRIRKNFGKNPKVSILLALYFLTLLDSFLYLVLQNYTWTAIKESENHWAKPRHHSGVLITFKSIWHVVFVKLTQLPRFVLSLLLSEVLSPKGWPIKASRQACRYFNYLVWLGKGVQWSNVNNIKMMSKNISNALSLAYPKFCVGSWLAWFQAQLYSQELSCSVLAKVIIESSHEAFRALFIWSMYHYYHYHYYYRYVNITITIITIINFT